MKKYTVPGNYDFFVTLVKLVCMKAAFNKKLIICGFCGRIKVVIGGDLMSKGKDSKKDIDFKKVMAENAQPHATNNAIKSIVGDFGGTATSAYSHPVDYNKTPLFSSGGLSIHEAEGQPVVPLSTENGNVDHHIGAE